MIMVACMAVFFSNTATAQSCEQVQINYNEPDCYKRKDQSPAGDQNRDCKEAAACKGVAYSYSASGTWATYNWTITGPATPPILPNNTSPNVNITWPVTGDYTLTLTVTDGSGNTFTTCIKVSVKDKPLANFSFTPNNACAPATVSFTDGTTFSGSYLLSWNFGDLPSGPANYSTLYNPTHTYLNSGTYTVTLIAYSFVTVTGGGGTGQNDTPRVVSCCADTIKKTVTVNPGQLKIDCISTVCAGKTVTYTAVGCANPIWLPPVGGTISGSSGNQVTITWGNGNPQGQIIAQCPGGCTASVPVPIVPTTPVLLGTPNLAPCFNSTTSYTLPYLPGTFYTWQLTNTTTGTNFNSLLTTSPDNNTVWINWNAPPATPGTYVLSFTLDNKHLCCKSTGQVTINPKPTFTLNPSPSTICTGTSITFSTTPSGSFNWTTVAITGVAPAGAGPAATYNPTFNTAGTYIVTATPVSGFCAPVSTTITVIAAPAPGTMSPAIPVCPGSQANYSMSPAPPSGYHYEWLVTGGTFAPSGGTTISGDNVTVSWTSLPATIQARLVRNSQPACASAWVTQNVPKATVGTIGGIQNVCVDQTENYTLTGGNLPPGEPITWTLTPSSQGTITSGQGTGSINVLWHGQTGAGPWTATITASTACGNALPSTFTVTIYPKFNFSITPSSGDVCTGGITLNVTGYPTGATFLWSNGSTATSIGPITSLAPPSYSVTVTKGCKKTQSFTIPDPLKIIPVTCGVGFCNGTTTNEILGVKVLSPLAATYTYQWRSGTCASPGAVLSTVTNTSTTNSFTAPAPGNYCVFVSYGSCTKCVDFTVKKVCCPNVNDPKITGKTQTSCDTYTFTGTSATGIPVTWDYGDGSLPQTVASGTTVTHTYNSAGIYCVTLCTGPPSPNPTSCTGNCVVTDAVVPLAASFNYTLGCNGCLNVSNTSTMIGNPSDFTYLWNFGDGNTSTLQNPPQHCYTSNGTYTVTLTVTYTNGPITCTKTATQIINYPPFAINVASPVCTGVPAAMSLAGAPSFTITSYTWNFGDGFTAYTYPTSHAYNSTGTYIVQLAVVDALGNTCTDTAHAVVKPGVPPFTVPNIFICPGGTATLTAPAGYNYLWSPGGQTTQSVTVTSAGTYSVTITNASGCSRTLNNILVQAAPKPKALFSISPSKNLCGPTLVTCTTPAIPGYIYSWTVNGSPAGGNSPMLFQFISLPTNTIQLIVENEYGCRDTCTQTIIVNTLPVAPVISASGPLCEGTPVTLTVTNYTGNITWNNGATTLSITVTAAGTYVATYTDPATGCSKSSSITVNRRPPVGLFPHFCDSIGCSCRDANGGFTIYAPKPLIGLFAANYNIQWFFNNSPAGTGPTFPSAQTGTYHIVVTDPATGCFSTSDKYSIVVASCDSCDCTNSHWGEIVLTPGEAPPPDPKTKTKATVKANVPGQIFLACNQGVTLECKKTYTLNASYICKDTSCPSKVTYSLQPPSGPAITGTMPPAFTFTPTQDGVYILTLIGWCDGKPCDTCVIDLTVKCDCCKGSKWKENPWYYFKPGNETPEKIKLDCAKEPVIYMKGADCKKPLVVGSLISCPPNCVSADSVFVYDNTNTLVLSGASPLTIPVLPNGTYTIVFNGYCGGTICLTCKAKLIVECEPPKPCKCEGSKWAETFITINNQSKAFDCKNNNSYNVKCNQPITVSAMYMCVGADCPGSVKYVLQPPTGLPITGTMPPPFTFVPNQAGTYTLTLTGMCGSKECDRCVLKFTTNCKENCCPPELKVTAGTPVYAPVANPASTIVSNTFSVSGLGLTNITEVRAEVVSYSITDNYGKECLKCVNQPFTWASIASATNINTALPKITLFGGATVPSFNGTGAGAYQNPREVIWNNGTNLNSPPLSNIGIKFILPPAPGIDCCELKGRICVKFTFRDKDCKECEAIACFEFSIKKN